MSVDHHLPADRPDVVAHCRKCHRATVHGYRERAEGRHWYVCVECGAMQTAPTVAEAFREIARLRCEVEVIRERETTLALIAQEMADERGVGAAVSVSRLVAALHPDQVAAEVARRMPKEE